MRPPGGSAEQSGERCHAFGDVVRCASGVPEDEAGSNRPLAVPGQRVDLHSSCERRSRKLQVRDLGVGGQHEVQAGGCAVDPRVLEVVMHGVQHRVAAPAMAGSGQAQVAFQRA